MKNGHAGMPVVVVRRGGIETPGGFELYRGMAQLVKGAQHYRRAGYEVTFGSDLPPNYRAELGKRLKH